MTSNPTHAASPDNPAPKNTHALAANLIFTGILLALSLGLCLIPSPGQAARQTGIRERAIVLEADNSMVLKHAFVRFGSQRLKVRMTEGEFKGKIFSASNELRAQLELDKLFAPGDRIIVVRQAGDRPGAELIAKDYSRTPWTMGLFAIFCLCLCVFGGWTGVKALFSFLFSCLVIWKAVIPLTLRGWNASWTIFLASALLTAAIIFLVGGLNRKGLSAFLGATLGIFSGLATAHIFTLLMKINGATQPYSQTLIFSGCDFLNLQDIFVGAMILAASGAVMDLAMDIASGVEEVARHNPALTAAELTASGLRIGRNVVGTMTTTLLLAYSGGFLTLLMMFSLQGNSPLDILNNPLVAAEAVKTLIGSFALVLVAPFTAAVAGWLFRAR